MTGDAARAETIALGVVAGNASTETAVGQLVEDLREALPARFPSVPWDVVARVEGPGTRPATLTELLGATRRRLLDESWDLAICVTELPLRAGRRPVTRHASPSHHAAVVSLPALGVVGVRRRLCRSALELVGAMLGGDGDREQQLLAELGEDVAPGAPGGSVAFVGRVATGNLRLLVGMVRANRPWRLAARLYRALVTALAAVAFGTVTQDLWRMAASVGPVRLIVAMAGSLVATVFALVAVHGLWERAPRPEAREQVVLFNLATVLTLALGVAALYAALFAITLLGCAVLISPHAWRQAVGQGENAAQVVALAWLVASLSTIGGALGGSLESDEAVREAAYGFRPEERT